MKYALKKCLSGKVPEIRKCKRVQEWKSTGVISIDDYI